MSTITMELPDAVAAQLATEEGMARAKSAVLAAFGMEVSTEPDEETLAGLRRGLEDITAGRTSSLETAYIQGREELLSRMRAPRV